MSVKFLKPKPVLIYYFSYFLFALLPAFPALQDDLTALFQNESPQGTQWSVLFETAEGEKNVFSLTPDIHLIPASNMKIVISAAALLALGPDYVYETTLYRTGVLMDDNVHGNLVVMGTGDPSIGGRFNGGDLTETFRQWAAKLKQKKMTVITGDIIGVDYAFDDKRHGLNWQEVDLVEWYAAEISALSFNDSCIDLIITGASSPGKKALVKKDPPTKYIKIINQVKTVRTRKQERIIEYKRDPKSTMLTVSGAIRKKSKIQEYASVPNPTLFFLTVLKETLEKEGIQIQGKVRAAKRKEAQLLQENWHEITAHRSPPLSDLVKVCLTNSQNLYAELFLKTLGLRAYGRGTHNSGVLTVKDVLFMNGCSMDGEYIADGSGLSRDNRLSARTLTKILRCMNESKHAEVFRSCLPQSGTSGTLKQRMKDSSAYQRVFAKTGTLNGSRALSGYLKAKSGKEYIFSMLANGAKKDSSRFNKMMDKACEIAVDKG